MILGELVEARKAHLACFEARHLAGAKIRPR